MANIVLPNPEQHLGTAKCTHCGAEAKVKLDPVWYRFFKELRQLVNQQLT